MPSSSKTRRQSLQRMIHVGCKELGIDSDTRHDLQLAITGKSSMSEMTDDQLLCVVEGLKAKGFNGGFKGKKSPHAPAPRADLRFIHVMWKLLSEAGAVQKPGRAGLNAFIRSAFEGKWQSLPIDIDALREAGQINDVVQALKAMCRRAKVKLL